MSAALWAFTALYAKKNADQKRLKFQEIKARSLSNATIVYVDTLSETILAVISENADATFGFGTYLYMRQTSKLGSVRYSSFFPCGPGMWFIP
ncbi:hypothetical protein [uncultured Desulfobacter sp.]|uniref:hypothetical protein n=1 Tax=uncultured Desulfobacter sp. TaxID=240139 RepID=UPI002AAB508E|nr:hypothetical protein [uncultured Desulfobacter sp.]